MTQWNVNAQVVVTRNDNYGHYSPRTATRTVKLEISDAGEHIDKIAERIAVLVKEAGAA